MVTVRPKELDKLLSMRVRKLSAFRNNGTQAISSRTMAITEPTAIRILRLRGVIWMPSQYELEMPAMPLRMMIFEAHRCQWRSR